MRKKEMNIKGVRKREIESGKNKGERRNNGTL